MVIIGFAFLVVIYLLFAIKIVPQSQNWLVERLGKFNRRLEAGLHIIIPFFEAIRYKVDILERQLPSKPIHAITHDNVNIDVTIAVLYRVNEASKTMYRINNIDDAILTIVNGTIRSVIGKTELDGVQSNRRQLAEELENELKEVASEWGIILTRIEITDVEVDAATREAMQLQMNAERNRRAFVREAEGQKEAVQLQSDAELYAATKKAEAKRILADAEAYSVTAVANAISNGGASAIEFEVKKIQAGAIQSLGEGTNSKIILLPTSVLESLSGTIGNIVSKIK
jgi:regulator of protease activity HflC (stomatin/prohibitin superfamily)